MTAGNFLKPAALVVIFAWLSCDAIADAITVDPVSAGPTWLLGCIDGACRRIGEQPFPYRVDCLKAAVRLNRRTLETAARSGQAGGTFRCLSVAPLGR